MLSKKITSLLKQNWLKVFSVTFLFLFFGSYANIFAIASPYNPGETLDPTCLPGEVNCTVDLGGGSVWQESGSDIYFDTGKVGIGTDSPTANLAINAISSTGPELITNGTFDTDASGWNIGTYGVWNNGQVTVTRTATGSGFSNISTTIDVEAGKLYLVTATLSNVVPDDEIYISFSNIDEGWVYLYFPPEETTSFIFRSDYTGTDTIRFNSYLAQGDTWTIDDISLKEISIEQSLNVYDSNNTKILSLGDDGSNNIKLGERAGLEISSAIHSNFIGYNSGYNSVNGAYSNFIGYHAGYNAVSDSDSYTDASNFMGWYAGANALNAEYVNFLGSSAGYGADDTYFSNFIGTNAGEEAIGSSDSNFIGYYAGSGASDSHYSNFFGHYAGSDAINSFASNFIGGNAGDQAANSPNSNFIGTNAGSFASNSAYSNFMGYRSGYSADNASNSIFLGQYSGYNDTVNNTTDVDDWSILLGYRTNTGGFKNSILLGGSTSSTPISNTKANQFMLAPSVTEMRLRGIDYTLPSVQGGASTVLTNDGSGGLTWASAGGGGATSIDELSDAINDGVSLFLGTGAGVLDDLGYTENTGVGIGALHSNTDGGYNVAVGYQSLYANDGGWQNTAIGHQALLASVNADYNTAVGNYALSANTTGADNTAVGYNSLSSNLAGLKNTAIGDRAMTASRGNSNVALGYGALYGSLTPANNTGNYNVALGSESLDSYTSGSNNIIIGYRAGDTITTGSTNLAIGYDVDVVSATGSNQMTIGNLIFATGGFGTGTTIGVGNIGIANNTPSYRLHVGNSSVAGIVARFENGTGTCDINPTTASLVCSSDINLKKNIVLLSNNQDFLLDENIEVYSSVLENMKSLTPVFYNWDSEEDDYEKHVGLIAQEVEQVFPGVVFTDANTGLKSIAYTNLLPYAIQAIKELDLKVEGLTSLDAEVEFSLGSLIKKFLADVGNGLEVVFFGEVRAKRLCLDGLCIERSDLESILNKQDISYETNQEQVNNEPIGDEPTDSSDDSTNNDSSNNDSTDSTEEDSIDDPSEEPSSDEPADSSDDSTNDDSSSGDSTEEDSIDDPSEEPSSDEPTDSSDDSTEEDSKDLL